jgi:8-oxo-dGTP diphosphatase
MEKQLFKTYVLGFAINIDRTTVLLIEKSKPDWQKGKLNGIGGKIEPRETPLAAMVREYEEETGITTTETDWSEFCIMHGPGWRCHCFKAFTDEIFWAQKLTDEMPIAVDLDRFDDYTMISNVPWLVQMALDNCSASSDSAFHATVSYK